MGVDIVLQLQPVEADAGAVTVDEVAEYWRRHGSGPLPPELEGPVRHAIAAARQVPAPDPLPIRAFEDRHGRDRSWWDRALTASAEAAGPLSDFQGHPEGARWFDPEDARETVRALRAAHPERAEFLDALDAALASMGRRRFRMLAFW